jgi:hypothetical protein
MKIEIEISENALQLLPPDTETALRDEEKLKKICSDACEEILGWLAGERVYGSLSEQYLRWVEIYFPTLFPNTMPTANRLYNDFMIPAGRAAYLARILAEKRQSYWRTEARKELVSAMNEKRTEADEHMKSKDYFELVPITISTMAERELRSFETQIFEEDHTISTYRIRNRKPDIVTAEIPTRTYILIHERIK